MEYIFSAVFSTAYSRDHPEIQHALHRGIPVRSYTDVLAELFNQKKGIMVTGTHGKTTATAIIGRILEEAGWDPTVLVGGEVLEWNSTVRYGKSEWMISEGDEYQGKMLTMRPHALLITNMDYDHPDYYKDPSQYEAAFKKLFVNTFSASTLPPMSPISSVCALAASTNFFLATISLSISFLTSSIG